MKKDAKTPSGQRIDGMYNGFPYEGPPLNLKNDDPESMKPRFMAEVAVNTFLMSNPDDVKKYENIMKEVGLGWAKVSKEEIEWMPRHETWKIFLRMMHLKYIEPEDLARVQDSV